MRRQYSTWGPAVLRKGTKRKFKTSPLPFTASKCGQCDLPETYPSRRGRGIYFWGGSTRRSNFVTPSDGVIPGIEDGTGWSSGNPYTSILKMLGSSPDWNYRHPDSNYPCFSSVSPGKWWDITLIKPRWLLLNPFSIYYSAAITPFAAIWSAYEEWRKMDRKSESQSEEGRLYS
jgi:hypothetical protein